MRPSKFRFRFNSPKPEECTDISMHEALDAIKYSCNCFVLYSQCDGQVEVLFTGLNEQVFFDFIIMMCRDERFLKFIKLAVISTERIKRIDKKGMDFAVVAAKYIQETFGGITKQENE